MVLDHSGPALGLIHYASAIKLFAFASLIVRLVLPAFPGAPHLHYLGLLAGLLLVAVLVGMVESTMARLSLARLPQLLVTACLLSGFGLLLAARG
jgi:formate hydrogenlyase subunit 4